MLTLKTVLFHPPRALTIGLALSAAALCTDLASAQSNNRYRIRNLVSDGAINARHTDPALVNAWGIAAADTGPMVVSNNGTGTATMYNRSGGKVPIDITILGVGGATNGTPTGVVANTTSDFVIAETSVPADFIFVSLDGSISAWNSVISGGETPEAAIVVDNSGTGAVYTGATIGSINSGSGPLSRLYVANFGNRSIDVFDGDFNSVSVTGSFDDSRIPDGYAPFNITNINDRLYVSFAKVGDEGDEEVGAGKGFIDVFDLNGHLLDRLVRRGALNAPWAMTLAPGNFGRFSDRLLVGNFGNGRINAYNLNSGRFLGPLRGLNGRALRFQGLWGLAFGNGDDAGTRNTLFFAAGPEDETEGLFGRINRAPSSASETAADEDETDSE